MRISLDMSVTQRNFDADHGSLTRLRPNRQLAAQQLGALGNTDKTKTAMVTARTRGAGRKPSSIVLNRQQQLVHRMPDSHTCCSRLRVLHQVVNALLDNAVEVDLRILGKNIIYPVDLGGEGDRR